MVPAAAVDQNIADRVTHLETDDILIDGGNSDYVDDIVAPRNSHGRKFII